MRGPFKKLLQFSAHEFALIFFLVGGALFYARPEQTSGFTYFGNFGDPLCYIWYLNWWHFAWQHHLPFFHTYFAYAPTGIGLAWTTNIFGLGLLLAPLTGKFGALAVYNGLMLVVPGLVCWGAYLTAFELTEDFAAALVAGLVMALSSYMLGELIDHLNLTFTLAVFLCLWAGIAAAKHGWSTWRLGLVLAPFLAFQFGISPEIYTSFSIFSGITLGVACGLAPDQRPMIVRLLPGLALGLGLSLILLSPVIWQMLLSYSDAGRSIAAAKNYSSDLLGFVLPTPIYALGGQALLPVTNLFEGNIPENGTYIGAPLLALLVWLGWQRRREPRFAVPALVALIAAVLSLGPYAHLLGREVSTAPWLIAYKLPFLKSMLPMRFMFYAWAGIAMLLATWLAAPGPKPARYALLAVCLLCLTPSRGYDRNWTHVTVPALLTDGTLPPGSRIMILPELFQETGLQYAAGMQFQLVAQGYLSSGTPGSFAEWPLYRTIFLQKYQKYLNLVDPHMLAAFLATYQVQDVVVTGNDAAFADAHAQSAILARLLPEAGWALVKTDQDARLYRPATPQMPPDAAQIAAYMHVPRPENRQRAIEYETYWVRGIRLAAQLTGQNPAPLLAIYANHAHPPLPVADIAGGAQKP